MKMLKNRSRIILICSVIVLLALQISLLIVISNAHTTKNIAPTMSEKDIWDIVLQIIMIIVTSIGLFYVNISLKNQIKNQNLHFLAELDKVLIQHPELNELYDKNINFSMRDILINSPEKNLIVKNINESFCIEGADQASIEFSDESIVLVDNLRVQTNHKIVDNQIHIVEINGSATVQFNNSDFKVKLKTMIDKMLDHKLQSYCYYHLNHFEVAINTRPFHNEWQDFMVFCLKHSTRFKDLTRKIVHDNDYLGMYPKSTKKSFKKMLDKAGF